MKTTGITVDLAHEAMATAFRLRLVAETETLARQAAAAGWNEVARLEALLSRYIEGSDISRINAAAAGEHVRINADTMECLATALRMAALTENAFHPLLGRSTRAGVPAGSGPTSARYIPDAALLLDPKNLTGTRTIPDSQLDLGGIGKGFAVDKLVALLREWEIPAGCVDAGGSTVSAFGRPLADTTWQAQLEAHQVALENASIAASGTSVKGNHIVDGRNGLPCTHHVRVWSYAPSATEADALSTAFFAFSTSEIERFCAQNSQYGAAWLTPENTLHRLGALRMP